MDWWKLFGGTFILIFLAELGDKTQLAAMAKTADSPDDSMAKWIVFVGASAALVASTFIAVFLGHLLKAVVPDERYIRLAAALLFLIFGFSLLREAYLSFRSEGGVAAKAAGAEAAGEAGEGGVGVVGGLALRAAMELEARSQNRYRELARQAPPELSAVLRELARDEASHLAHLHELTEEERGDTAWREAAAIEGSGVSGRGFAAGTPNSRLLGDLIRHEEATAAFYRGLAGRTLIPSVRSVLLHLAMEEERHAGKLRRFV